MKKKLRTWLVKLGHPDGEDVVLSLLGLLAHQAYKGESLVGQIAEMQNAVVDAEASHFVILPGMTESSIDGQATLHFEGFAIGPLKDATLKSRCSRAGSDFFIRYGAGLKGRFTLESPTYMRRLFNWLPFLESHSDISLASRPYQLVLNYYEAMSRHHIDMMWNDFSEKQLLYTGLGHAVLNVRQFSRQIGTQRITVYLGISRKKGHGGYVVPYVASTTMLIPSPEEKGAHIQMMKERYAFESLSKSFLYPLLLSVCRSVEQARGFKIEERMDEAFLYSVIALEQVFSEKESTTKRVSERTALVVHRQLGIDYSEAKRRMEKLYDSRSRFVHRGERIKAELIIDIEPVVTAVIRSLIYLCRQQTSVSPEFNAKWLKSLDYIVAGFGAGKQPSEDDLMENGILPTDHSLSRDEDEKR
ncbi:MAG TPA: hypothetical protein PLA50_07575 [Bacteroidia bacterium]|nr:hypothetical protein [Bacteroidia bacterium]